MVIWFKVIVRKVKFWVLLLVNKFQSTSFRRHLHRWFSNTFRAKSLSCFVCVIFELFRGLNFTRETWYSEQDLFLHRGMLRKSPSVQPSKIVVGALQASEQESLCHRCWVLSWCWDWARLICWCCQPPKWPFSDKPVNLNTQCSASKYSGKFHFFYETWTFVTARKLVFPETRKTSEFPWGFAPGTPDSC